MTLNDFLNSIEYPVVFVVGHAWPAGQTYAIFEGTELPFCQDDTEVEGEVDDNGEFNCTNITRGTGAWDYNFSSIHGGQVWTIRASNDRETWIRELIDYATHDGFDDAAREYVKENGGEEALAEYDKLAEV